MNRMKRYLFSYGMGLIITIVPCFCLAISGNSAVTVNDPFEPVNRVTFTVNQKLDKYAMKPLAEFYNKAMPRPLNIAVDHFYDNIINVPTILNDLLQANFYQATSDSWRLAINTTAGLGGCMDVAKGIGLEKNEQGFGLTFAKWGYLNSRYFVIPVIGPSTIRDAVGWGLDFFSSPIPYLADVATRNTLFGVFLLDQRAQLLRFQGVFDELAIDPYIFARNAYIQHRNYLIQRNKQLDDPYSGKETEQLEENFYLLE